jgi:hypothetical protein
MVANYLIIKQMLYMASRRNWGAVTKAQLRNRQKKKEQNTNNQRFIPAFS